MLTLVWHAFAPVGTRERVLVVDDDASIRQLLSTALEDDGYEVVPAANGEDALAVCARWRPDVIVLDLMMPVMDGWTFAKRLRERDDIPIVVLSAANDLERHAKSVGAIEVIGKPFDLDQLIPKVARARNAV
ncbi:MAG: response regulator [Chloroflexi bacterium]|nr:MAG: response regulator [Chloroflexota bacterium]